MSLFIFNDPATTAIYTLSLHDALPIWHILAARQLHAVLGDEAAQQRVQRVHDLGIAVDHEGTVLVYLVQAFLLDVRSEEHTSELQSRRDLVCRLLLEKKKKYLDFPIHP